ncbi:MAG TPA: alpha-amylase family protein [Tepidisphaeraceae bacterium]|nr:alpha-amylase family protein [Tepidisphaeraceae bacterium]
MDPQLSAPATPTRREVLKAGSVIAAAATTAGWLNNIVQAQPVSTEPATPWYRRTYRWAQTNITEGDVDRYDIPWWRQHWKRTMVQGVIINAGGIFAYYPSKVPMHYRPPQLGDRDLYGDVARAAKEDGLVVLARMDSSRSHEPLYQAHPDWFAVDANGRPFRTGDLITTCINSPYYEEYLPDILREIVERSHPQGFTDNSWAGMGRSSICYCQNCQKRFKDYSKGKDLPKQHDWNDPIYRQWITWSYARRLEVWDFFSRVTREAGGPDCLWLGMNGAGITGQAASFRDSKEIFVRSEMVMLDHQARSEADGLQDNATSGKLIHGVLGWDKLIPESMPMYQNGRPATFRLEAKSEPEARMWMLSGFAGGIQPWYHHVGAYQEDRRAYLTAEPIMKWHAANEKYLVNRQPIADVGIVWSQRNTDFFGRDNAEELVDQPYRGFAQAMIRARIPFVPVHIDHIERDGAKLKVLVLPNIGAMSDSQVTSVRAFVQRGGSIIASGQTSLYDEWGDARNDFALAKAFGASGGKPSQGRAGATSHTYLRLAPELRGQVYGPKSGEEPAISGQRHQVLAGFELTDILEFGGSLQPLKVDSKSQVLLTFIPSFPIMPPETAYMRTTHTDIPGLIVSETGKSRVAFMPADIDRQFAVNNFPDHGNLLANIVRWAAGGDVGLDVQGRGLVNCELYQQPGRVILHLVNVTSANTWRAPVHELIPIGPLSVKVRLPKEMEARSYQLLVSGDRNPILTQNGVASIDIKSVLDHEVIVLE